MMNLIILTLVVLIASGLALMLADKMMIGKKLLATASTIGLFYILGTTVYQFLFENNTSIYFLISIILFLVISILSFFENNK